MEVKQIYDIMNTVTGEVLGKSDIVAEDLSNIVDVGKEIIDNDAVDNYVKSLVNRIGKVIFVNRPYSGSAPGRRASSASRWPRHGLPCGGSSRSGNRAHRSRNSPWDSS